MPLPSHFYYAITTSDTTYGYTQSHNLNFTRFIQNKPYWPKPSESIKYKPKTLFIQGLSSINKLEVLKERILTLKQLGFKIYTLSGPLAILKEFDSAFSLDTLPGIEIPSYESCLNSIKSLNLTADEILVLSADDIQRIILGDDDDWNQLESFQLVNLCRSNISEASLLRLLSEKGLEIEHLNLSGCINVDNLSPILSNNFNLPKLKSLIIGSETTKYGSRTTNLSSLLIAQLLSTAAHLESIELLNLSPVQMDKNVITQLKGKTTLKSIKWNLISEGGVDETVEELLIRWCHPLLTCLEISRSISLSTFQTILTYASNLQTVNLVVSHNTESDLILPHDLIFPHMQELNLPRSKINTQQLANIIKRAPNLKVINLTYCDELKDELELEEYVSFPALKKLDFNASLITISNLGAILQCSPNLEIINLADCKSIGEALIFSDHVTFARLISCNLSYSNITAQSLGVLLQRTPNIRDLNLENCKSIDDVLFLDEYTSFLQLESLNLSDSNVTSQSFWAIMQRSPNLRAINFSGCENFTHSLELTVCFQHLSSINFNNSNICISSLGVILQHAPNIKTLTIDDCKNMEGILSLNELLTFPQLHSLDCRNSNISGENIGAILSRAPNLQTIDFSRSDNIEDPFDPVEVFKLSQLDTLLSDESTITLENVKLIIQHAINLKKIGLEGCSNLGGVLELDEQATFPQLKSLDLNASNVTIQSVGAIIQRASNLETINLADCENLGDMLELDEHVRFFRLESLELNRSNVTMQNLGAIIQRAPNLKTINLNSCESLDEMLELDEHVNFSLLESLDLNASNITIQSVGAIIQRAPNLKTLNLNSCESLDEMLELDEHISFSRLESLNFNHSNITLQSIETIIQRAPNLQHIELANCNDLENLEFKIAINFLKLKLLRLNASNINIYSLSEILHYTPNLKTLFLCNCKNLLGTLELNAQLCFPQLEALELNGSNINIRSLEEIIRRAPNLKHLDLSNCKNLNGDLALAEHFKHLQLRSLYLNNSSFSTQNIHKILHTEQSINELRLQAYNNVYPIFENFRLNGIQALTVSSAAINNKLISYLKCNEKHLFRLSIYGAIDQEIIDNIRLEIPSADIQFFAEIPERRILSRKALSTLANTRKKIDADTTFNPDKSFIVEQIFFPVNENMNQPRVLHYRLISFNSAAVDPLSCNINCPFELENVNDLQLSDYNIFFDIHCTSSLGIDEYIGKNTLHLTHEWQALPSLSPYEKLIELRFRDRDDDALSEVDLKYSNRDNLYYIRSKSNIEFLTRTINISFKLLVPKIHPPKLEFFQPIIDKINYYKAFQPKSVVMTKLNPTGDDFIRALEEQKVGSCRHRVFLFKVWMHENYPEIRVRIILNACHAYVEIEKSWDAWIKVDLGGYPCKINVKKPVECASLSVDKVNNNRPPLKRAFETTLSIDQRLKESRRSNNYFNFSVPDTTQSKTPMSYLQELVSNANQHHATLIKVLSSNYLKGLSVALQTYCQSISRPCFYAHTPEDLICSAHYIERQQDNTGLIQKGPGGKLHRFLTTHATDKTKPVLIINYDNFLPKDLVSFNTLLDEKSHSDDTPLPNDIHIIGLMNPNKPGAYDGADFSSRFDSIEYCPFEKMPWILSPLYNLTNSVSSPTKPWRIELYGGHDWEDQLLGSWALDGQLLRFHPGPLLVGLQLGYTHFELSNAPWNDDAFECFWRQALVQGQFNMHGIIYSLPHGFSLYSCEGYFFSDANHYFKPFDSSGASIPCHTLNPSLMSRIFGQYQCKGNSVYKEPGLIEQNNKGILNFYVTHSLDEASWARLLELAKKHQVTLYLDLALNVKLPKWLQYLTTCTSTSLAQPWPPEFEGLSKTAYIYSTDIDTTVDSLACEHPLIFEISEVEPSNLLKKIDGYFDKTQLKFLFHEEIGALHAALDQNKSVVLKGHFSLELQQMLAEVIWQRQQRPSLITSALWLIGQEPLLFPFVSQYKHMVTAEEKRHALTKFSSSVFITEEMLFESKGLAQLITINNFQRWYPDQGHTLAWQGLHTLPSKTIKSDIKPDIANAKAVSETFNLHRLNAIQTVLSMAPYVFLAGMSGVGKTSFVKNYWINHIASLHIGEEKMQAWAIDKTPGIKTLFIDEANITSRDWSEFEGLFHPLPGILIGNQFFELTPEHKVVFAGNPVMYGGERGVPALIQRHGNCLIFTEMPPEYIYNEILRPILIDLPVETSHPILEVAAFITQCSAEEVLITPRELITMALFTKAYCHKYPQANPTHIAQNYAYNLGYNLVPEAFKQPYKQRFETNEASRLLADYHCSDFFMTPSHQRAWALLNDFLYLRVLQQTSNIDVFKNAVGLGGLIIEGEPGLGKTKLVTKILQAYGLEKANNQLDNEDKSVFYDIPVSMPLNQKSQLILKAFHEGAPVVMDEINSGALMERLMNSLLMGYTPDGLRAKKPGFILIGTQNPVTMAGRTKASTALQRRMKTVTILDYTPQEVTSILRLQGHDEESIDDMVEEYFSVKNAAKFDCKAPKFCPRHLFKHALNERIKKTSPESEYSQFMDIENASEKQYSYLNLVANHGLFKRGCGYLNQENEEREYKKSCLIPLQNI